MQTELFDQHEHGKNHKDLTARTTEENQHIVKPIARADDDIANLRAGRLELWEQ